MKKAIRKVWRILPPGVRLGIVRATQRKFTFSAAVFVVDEEGRVLLLNHVLRPFSGWGLPGGFIGHGEQPEEAIRRELLEEVGIELEDLKMYRIRTIRKHVEILFTAAPKGDARVLSREIIELGWFACGELPGQIGKTQREMIERLLGCRD
ncbi:MAG: NUDIX domain-containing protein [Pyrinomonadaceae bacterium]|nr:NUDIX domain-containing protein [Pyrinomonadaceae bacterium]